MGSAGKRQLGRAQPGGSGPAPRWAAGRVCVMQAGDAAVQPTKGVHLTADQGGALSNE